MLSFIHTFEHIGRAAELVGFQVDEIGAGVARVDGLVFKHFADFVNARVAETIHNMDIVPQIDIMEETPAQVIMGDQANVAVFGSQLEIGSSIRNI